VSVDKYVTEDLMELLQDSIDGLTAAADMLAETGRSDLAARFRGFGAQRARFYTELEALAAAYGDDIEESGSTRASVHRVWMSVNDTLSGSDPAGVLEAAVVGEEHAASTYAHAMEQDISLGLREVLERQFPEIRKAHVEVRILNQDT